MVKASSSGDGSGVVSTGDVESSEGSDNEMGGESVAEAVPTTTGSVRGVAGREVQVVLDMGHNPAAMGALSRKIAHKFAGRNVRCDSCLFYLHVVCVFAGFLVFV